MPAPVPPNEADRLDALQKINAILERISDGFVAFDAQMNYTYVNTRGGELLGRNPADLVGKNYWEEFPEARGTPFANAYVRALEAQTPVVFEDYYAPWDRWFENRIYPSPDGLAIFFQDITERKRAEQALRESEERLARIVETVPEGITIVNREGQITFANAAAERILGLTRGDITDRAYDDPGWRITAVDGSPFPDEELPFAQVMRSGQPVYGVEHAIEHPDGQRVILSINAAPLREAEGEFSGMVAAISDITERKQAEAALRQSEQKFSILFDKAAFAASLSRLPEGVIVDVNEAFERALGYTKQEVVGKTSLELGINPDSESRARIIAAFEEQGSVRNQELTLRTKSGEPRVFSVNTDLVDIGGQKLLLNTTQDITERKQAEAALRESEARYRLLVDTSPYAIGVHQDGRLTFVNPAACHLLGAQHPGQLLGKSISEIIHPEGLAAARDRIQRMLAGESGLYPAEDRYVRLDGRAVPVEVTAAPFIYQGRPALQVIALDITERKRAEQALRESETRIRRLFEQANDGIFVISAQNRYLNANLRGLEMLGYTREELLKMGVADVLVPDERQRLDPESAEMMAGKPHLAEWAHQRKDGSTFPGEVSARPLNDQSYLAIVRDLTERKRTEATLRRNEEVLRLFVEHSPAAIAMLDREMRYIVASRRYSVDYELGEQNLVGRSHYEVFPEIPERWKEIHRRCLAGAIEKADEDPFPRADSRLDWVRWEIRPWHETGGDIGGLILFSEVITERKQAEASLRESERRFSETLENLQLIAVMLDAEGKVTFCNDYLLALTTVSKSEPHVSTMISPLNPAV